MVFEKANYFKEKLARCNEESELIEDDIIPGDDGENPDFSDDEELPADDDDTTSPGDDDYEVPADDTV